MRKEKKQEIKKQEKKQEKPEIKKPEETKEVTSLQEAIALQKQGFIVTDVKSEIGGVRPKTWILKK